MLLFQPFPLQSGQAAKLHVQDGLGLDLTQRQALHQIVASVLHVLGSPDYGYNFIDAVQCEQQPLNDMVSVLRPL